MSTETKTTETKIPKVSIPASEYSLFVRLFLQSETYFNYKDTELEDFCESTEVRLKDTIEKIKAIINE